MKITLAMTMADLEAALVRIVADALAMPPEDPQTPARSGEGRARPRETETGPAAADARPPSGRETIR